MAASSERTTPLKKRKFWYLILGHASKGVITKTIPLVDGVSIKKSGDLSECDTCSTVKSVSQPQNEASEKCTGPLDLVYSDVIGSVKQPSINGARYAVNLYDDYSALSLIRFLKNYRTSIEGNGFGNRECNQFRGETLPRSTTKNVQRWRVSREIVHLLVERQRYNSRADYNLFT